MRLRSHEGLLLVKGLYTLGVSVVVPVYWHAYGPRNFLWFSDLALLLTVAALWLESPLLASMQAVAVVLLELLWIVDVVGRLVTGVHIIGIATYMFQTDKPRLLRGLSLFHVVLPFLLLWLVARLGYDPRAWLVQTLVAWVVLPVCYWYTDPADNINWVFGPGQRPQTWMAPALYVVLLMLFFPLCVYLPTHLVLQAIMPQ
jgi:hypothetical protein